jgi:cation diffusion facilitator family transporter
LPSDQTGYREYRTGRRVAAAGVAVSAALAATNIVVGLMAGSSSVLAVGVEFLGDVLASAVVFTGLTVAAKPPDTNHPYGHGRFELLAGLAVGLVLAAGGAGISYRSLQRIGDVHPPPGFYALWALVAAIVIRTAMSTIKFRVGKRIGSESLVADAWNDAVDILSASAALVALGLTLYDPARFLAADHFGGFAVGLVVIFTGLRVMRDTSLHLMDTMPAPGLLDEIRRTALAAPGVHGVEKCFARKTGLKYHVDLHLEVDPRITVWESHQIATAVRFRIREQLPFVADVLVHVEPSPLLNPAPEPADK